MLAVFAALVLIPPIGGALGMCTLGWQQWLIVIGLSLIPLLIAEYGKLWDAIRSRTAEKTRVR